MASRRNGRTYQLPFFRKLAYEDSTVYEASDLNTDGDVSDEDWIELGWLFVEDSRRTGATILGAFAGPDLTECRDGYRMKCGCGGVSYLSSADYMAGAISSRMACEDCEDCEESIHFGAGGRRAA